MAGENESDAANSQAVGGAPAPPAKNEAVLAIRKNARPPPPLVLGDNKIENWKVFKARWQNYALLASLSEVPNELQVAQLHNCLGDDALKAMAGFEFQSTEANRTVEEIISSFETFVVGQVNETLERYKFGRRTQMEAEPFNRYLADLRRLMKTCGYCNTCEPSILRDRIIHGIRSDDIREDLLKEPKLTLPQCIDICTAGEAAFEHKSSIASERINKIYKDLKRQDLGPANTVQLNMFL